MRIGGGVRGGGGTRTKCVAYSFTRQLKLVDARRTIHPMYHEILLALYGFPGDLFLPTHLHDEMNFKVRKDYPSLHAGERELLEEMTKSGFYTREIVNLLEKNS